MNWSEQQSAIFGWFERGEGNLVVRARAGTGKTTTIIEGIAHASESSILLAAFNKRIAEELNARIRNPRAQAKTLHAVGFQFVRTNWLRVRVDSDRGFILARRALAQVMRQQEQYVPDALVTITAKLASVIKNTCVEGPSVSRVVDLALEHSVVPESHDDNAMDIVKFAEAALLACDFALDRDGSIDFDDMVWLPVVLGWVTPQFDLVVIDEAQDMNAVQLAMAQRLSRKRIAVVGDDKQAIYAFRGADSNAIDRLKTVLQAQELPLTVTYRCGQSIVRLAQSLCPDFEAGASNPEGEVQRATEEGMLVTVEPTDFVLSRLNAPLARICLTLIRAGKPARIEGRDIAKSLAGLVRKQRKDLIPDLLAKLSAWRDREISKLSASGRQSAQARIDYISEQYDTIEALCDGLAETAELLTRIDEMFAEGRGPAIVCSSVHKAKGLEARRVFVLTETLYCQGKRINQEERNIHYVAITRAKEVLVLVEKDNGGGGPTAPRERPVVV
jgi:DNA helicase-2/ATP-dependent DNA helicase PcrA